MFRRTISTVAFAQATKAYNANFEEVFKHALVQKTDVMGKGSAANPDLVEEALSTGPSSTGIVNAVIDSFRLAQVPVPSIPACTSYECKDGAVAKPPTDTANTANWGNIDSDWGVTHSSDQPYTGERNGGKAALIQMQAESIPNCNSFECKNGMVSGGPDNQNEAVPENWGQ